MIQNQLLCKQITNQYSVQKTSDWKVATAKQGTLIHTKYTCNVDVVDINNLRTKYNNNNNLHGLTLTLRSLHLITIVSTIYCKTFFFQLVRTKLADMLLTCLNDIFP